eukprot:14073817-Ditylum_brightwellii.AAC.1
MSHFLGELYPRPPALILSALGFGTIIVDEAENQTLLFCLDFSRICSSELKGENKRSFYSAVIHYTKTCTFHKEWGV